MKYIQMNVKVAVILQIFALYSHHICGQSYMDPGNYDLSYGRICFVLCLLLAALLSINITECKRVLV